MMRVLGVLAAISLVACPSGWAQEEPTWIERDGVVYGAKPDAQGPIGGGAGYTHIVTAGDRTATDLEGLVDALANAQDGDVVFIPGDCEIDMTTLIYIDELVLDVPAGVTLASDRGANGSPGALLTSDALKTPVMIRPAGPGVRVTGLRLRGPNTKRYLDHHRRAFSEGGGGHEYYYKFPTQNGIRTQHDALEVDNCDISGFGHAGTYLAGGTGHRIHHNYIHHCQYNGLGYGVSHGAAGSLIEYNLFNYNRHSIAGTGSPGCSYVARHNVELGVSLSHCFDMHGGRDRKDGTDIAGTAIEIYNNTFRAPERPIAIRGVPQDTCDVHHNWFLNHADAAQAVRASDKTNVFDNLHGPAPANP
ncbi:MAG: right-handed parallel beta-helix repeat-containing protein [Candidatus Hydrogenedentes bacterium]|nr:right-handed parallel beta-helix repeat-containing protein [Candidatus Hydrogenedentota bacterium]